MQPVSEPPFGFSGHEGFALRSLWLHKGVKAAEESSDAFTGDDATVRLGVGKNMVHSIRHWGLAAGALEVSDRGRKARPTELGRSLFGNNGWDPYFEDPATAWIVHWQLVAHPERSATWRLALTEWGRDIFSHDDLAQWIDLRNAEQVRGRRATGNSLRRDAEVFTRTYIRAKPTRELPLEDAFDSPLSDLALIDEIERGIYRIVRGPKPTLPDEVLWHSIGMYWQAVGASGTLSFERLLSGPGSPGAAFGLGDRELTERLERIPAWTGLRYDDTSGNRVVYGEHRGSALDSPSLAALRAYFAPQRTDGEDTHPNGQARLDDVR